jgi:hypothetical protein
MIDPQPGKPGRRPQRSCVEPPSELLMEFDADHLSRSPDNYAPMSGAVSSYQQCKLCRKLGRAAYLQRSSSLGLVPNEAGDREPLKFNASCFQTASTPVFSKCIVAFQMHPFTF